ncbi:MAG TPA: formyltetrahydrofolate deformylase [Gaiellaceae bacterium]|nr:formyltetrahydrofolate deformylase [Gaiellaceae bacterium]
MTLIAAAHTVSVPPDQDVARLVVACRDRHGIVAAISSLLAELGANIISLEQHSTDPENGMFFLRLEFHLVGFAAERERIEARVAAVAEPFEMDWRIALASERKRALVFVSRLDHCLYDLLWRWQRGELKMDVAGVVSNYPDHERTAASFGVEYHHVPVTRETRAQAEREVLDRFAGAVDLGILARYMQVLSPEFLAEFGAPIINIHHSFLPAFVGGNPYARAYERGVKLIGATAHYATADLDEGPIIEQGVERVSHVHDVASLARVGGDIERVVLARAVRWHLEDRVLVHGKRAIVFAG